jgi:hypothetical protein
MAKYHNNSPWLAVQIHFHLYFKCISSDGRSREANLRVTGLTVCGEDGDEGELFHSALSRNKGEGMNGTKTRPSLWRAVKHVLLLQRNQRLKKQRSEVFAVKVIKAHMVVEA